jgi:twitching motility two-component system response regulator PilG
MAAGLSRSLRDGMAAAHTGQFDRARVLLEQASVEAPHSAFAWFWLGISSQTPASALRCLRRVIEIDPSHVQARETMAKLLVVEAVSLRRDRAAARKLLGEAAAVAPNVADVWIVLAALSDTPADERKALRRAVVLAPDRTDLRHRLHAALMHEAVTLAKNGSKVEARRLFREAADLDPRDARVWQALAHLADKPADAIEAWRELVRLAPGQFGASAALKKAVVTDARALGTAGRKAEALNRWREAITLDDRDAELWLGLASASADDREIVRAVEAALSIDPAHREAGAWLARLRAHDQASGARDTTARRRTIMVVDDSPTIRKILGLTLERAGYSVVAEPDGERAVTRLAELVPDLILLDVAMPKLDGYEVCRRIKSDPRTAQVPVVMLSGKGGFFDKVKGRMVGATEYLTKPFEAPAVLAVIASHCRKAAEVNHG